MIKCEQIFSSFSTLIKNGLSVQRKLETERQLPKGPWAEKVRAKHSETAEGWPVVAWGQGPGLQPPRAHRPCPQRAAGAQSPPGPGTEQDTDKWVKKQRSSPDLGWGRAGKPEGFRSHKPSLLGSPPGLGWEHALKKGWGLTQRT